MVENNYWKTLTSPTVLKKEFQRTASRLEKGHSFTENLKKIKIGGGK